MIDWWALGYNALWVLGLAVGLGTLSLAQFEASRARVRLRKKISVRCGP